MKRRGPDDQAQQPPRQRQHMGYPPHVFSGRNTNPQAEAANNNTKLSTNDALTYLRDVKNKFQHNRHVYETFLEIMKEFKAQTIDTQGVIRKVKQLFKGNRHLIFGFNTFLPKGYEILMEDLIREEEEEAEHIAQEAEAEPQPKQPVEFDQAISYVNKIKDRFRSDESVYKSFLEILNQYRKSQKGIKEVYDQVARLFDAHDDLLEEFTFFLPDSQAPHKAAKERQAYAQQQAEQQRRRPPKCENAYGEFDLKRDGTLMFERIRKRVPISTWHDFLKILQLYSEDILLEHELHELVSLACASPSNDLNLMFNEFLRRVPRLDFSQENVDAITTALTNKTSLRNPRDKYERCPVSDLDLSGCERCSVSYVKLPADYPKLTFTARANFPPALQSIKLNDEWVSVTRGTEDYSFKHMRRNQYEEMLFRVEDDRYELDLLLDRNRSLLNKLKQLAGQMDKMSPEEKAIFRLDMGDAGKTGASADAGVDSKPPVDPNAPAGAEHNPVRRELSAVQEKHVTMVWGEGGEKMLAALYDNPADAVPVMLTRLEAKSIEWRKVVKDMERFWRKLFDQNYSRSLDHRSFYFKSIDKRVLSNRHIMSELKDAYEAQQLLPEAALQLHAAAPASLKLRPSVVLEMPDKEIHGHVWTIMRWGSLALGSSETGPQVEQFWTTVVAPFFSIPDLQAITPMTDDPSPAATNELPAPLAAGATSAEGSAAIPDDVTPPHSTGSSSAAGRVAPEDEEMEGECQGDSTVEANPEGRGVGGRSSAAPAGVGSAVSPQQPHDGAGDVVMQVPADAAVPADGGTAESEGTARGGAANADSEVREASPEARPQQEPDASMMTDGQELETDEDMDAVENGVAETPGDEDEDEDDSRPRGMPAGTIDFAVGPPANGKESAAWDPCPIQPRSPTELPLSVPTSDNEPPDLCELYCNENLYIFWRLYHFLYDRLRTARTCIIEKANARQEPVNGVDASKAVSALQHEFFSLVNSHVSNKIDSTHFEDACRAMLGANSYVLFTIQKLVTKLVRTLQLIIGDEPSVKLINLHHYEVRRKSPVSWATRFANAAGCCTDDHTIRLAARAGGSVAVTYLELDRGEPLAWPADPEAQAFVKAFLDVTEEQVLRSQASNNSPALFMRRCLVLSPAQLADPEARLRHLRTVSIRNGLESKLKTESGDGNQASQPARKAPTKRQTYKFNFVLDTEDAMLRRRTSRADLATRKATRVKEHTRFKLWLEANALKMKEDAERSSQREAQLAADQQVVQQQLHVRTMSSIAAQGVHAMHRM